MKQIGLAMHNHHDSYKYLPYARRTSAPQRSWAPDLLPFLEQANLVSNARFNLNANWYSGSATFSPPLTADGSTTWTNSTAPDSAADPNLATVQMPLSIFICPADPFPYRTQDKVDNPRKVGACGDYFVTDGVSANIVANGPLPTWTGGAQPGALSAFPNKVTFLAITDGTSSTILVGECAGREDVWRGRQRYAALADRTSSNCARAQGGAWATNDNVYAIGNGLNPWCGSVNPIIGPMPTPMKINASNESGYLYYSFHTGGASFCFADGSVRFLTESIDLFTLASLTTRRGGEVVGSLD
jgi:prepilin-type processing-associated H-X9-DG protein